MRCTEAMCCCQSVSQYGRVSAVDGADYVVSMSILISQARQQDINLIRWTDG